MFLEMFQKINTYQSRNLDNFNHSFKSKLFVSSKLDEKIKVTINTI